MSFKDRLFGRWLTIRNLFVAGNLLLLVLFLAAVAQDHFREWKPYQKEFYRREIQRLKAEREKAVSDDEKTRIDKELRLVKSQPVQVRQVIVDELKRVDRCTTCHLGYDSQLTPSLATSYDDHPFKAASPDIHKAHPVEKFACTVCHGGQGLATTVKDAHGEVKHWEKPLLRDVYLQASCVKCHGNARDPQGLAYVEDWRRGRALFKEKGCIGCHQVKGEGGPISVDLAEDTADKPLSRIDFSTTGLPKDEQTLANWIKIHFTMDPAKLVPGDPEGRYNDEPIPPSSMPFYDLSEKDAEALTTYVLSMAKDHIPSGYYLPGEPEPEPVFKTAAARGRHVYDKFGCAACHGPDGKGGIPNFNYENGVEPDLTLSIGTYTRDELKEKILKGVPVVGKADPKGPTPPLYMPPWAGKIKGQELEDLITYLFSIAEKQEEW
ncbi:MAG: cytochrome c [Elusimicrobiota bacterium]